MRRFEKLKMTLFDSTNANFRLGVEGQFTRVNPDGTHRDLVYISNKLVGYLNPNIYLTLEYKNDENPTAIYTSYPQLFKLRSAFGQVTDTLVSGAGFTTIDGELKVNANYGEPVVVSGIGKNNNWISIKLCVISSGENGVNTTEPGISIELSTAEKCISVFNVDEFLTLYTIIKDIDLAGISASMSLAFLETEPTLTPTTGYTNIPYQQSVNYVQPAPGYIAPQPAPQYPQNQGGYVAPHAQTQGYVQPKYNSTPRYNQQRQQVAPAPTQRVAVQPQGNAAPQMAPRQTQKVIMNPTAIEETPISETFYDDAQAIDDIFSED